MVVEVLVEEESAEAALELLLPKMLPLGTQFAIRRFVCKPDLLKRLPERLRAYARRIPREDLRIVVLVDEDRQDCKVLKKHLETIAADAGLVTKSASGGGNFQVVNRIAVEELEAWFFGDVPALAAAFPGVPLNLSSTAAYRNPDAIGGGTAEALHRVLKKARFYTKTHMPKVEVARTVASQMNPAANVSASFGCFLDGLTELVSHR